MAPLLTLHMHMCVEIESTHTDDRTLSCKLDYSSSSTLYTTLRTLHTLYTRVVDLTVAHGGERAHVEAPLLGLCVRNRRIVVHGVQNH